MEKQIKTLTGPEWPGVRYFSTTLAGGVSQNEWAGLNLGEHCGDEPEHVAKNRQRLYQLLPNLPHWLQQVHGTQLYQALKPTPKQHTWQQAPVADAAWTTTPKAVIVVLTADCLPVVITDEKGSIVGVAHAGWRGLADGVLEKLLLRLQQNRPLHTRWRAWIGPAISQENFEVGQDVFNAFVQKDKTLAAFFISTNQAGKYKADLAGLAKNRLCCAAQNNIDIVLSHACTFKEKQSYYSYRRQAKTGRIATIAWLE